MISERCLRVSEEFGEEEMEVPLEGDGTLLLTTLQSCFPGVSGLKFRNPTSGCYRAVKLIKVESELKFHPPGVPGAGDDAWDCDKINYLCVFPKTSPESKPTTEPVEIEKPPKPVDPPTPTTQAKTVDLIVLNLSPQTTEAELRKYFESKYGEVLMLEIKRDRKTGSSRRFAFIRFKHYRDQIKALLHTMHKIDGQSVRVALPDYRDPAELYQENKCFIGRVNEAIKAGDLREFFAHFGEIVEVSYPKKFKGYAFVTFADADVARKICGQDFVIKGYSVCVSKSNGTNNKPTPAPNMAQQYGGYSQNDWNGGYYARERIDPWMPGASPYVTAPLNPPMDTSRNSSNNFYRQTAALSSMGNSLLSMGTNVNSINALSMAMGNLLNNSMQSSTGMHNMNVRNKTFHQVFNFFLTIFDSFPAQLPRPDPGNVVEPAAPAERHQQNQKEQTEEAEDKTEGSADE